MKIILQAIKALFRKVENAIRKNVSAISKMSSKIASVEKSLNAKVNNVQSTANDAVESLENVQNTVNETLTKVENALTKVDDVETKVDKMKPITDIANRCLQPNVNTITFGSSDTDYPNVGTTLEIPSQNIASYASNKGDVLNISIDLYASGRYATLTCAPHFTSNNIISGVATHEYEGKLAVFIFDAYRFASTTRPTKLTRIF